MLVLSRKLGESIVIREDIVIKVVEIRGDKVRLAIAAPADVPVNRQEIHDAIQCKRAAATEGGEPGDITPNEAA